MRRSAYGGRLRLGLTAAAAVLVAGCGGGDRHPITTTRAVVTATPEVKRVPPPVPPELLALRASLYRWLDSSGEGLVYDLGAHTTLFSQGADRPRPPASVEKLYTTAALLRRLGPAARFETTVLGAGFLGAGGVWHGDLYLRGGGDPTLGDGTFNRVWERGYGPTGADLAGQLRAAGIRRVTGKVIADPSLFDQRPGVPSSGYAPDIGDLGGQLSALTYDHGSSLGAPSPAVFAAKELARTMGSVHIGARAAQVTGATPAGARPLASVSSPPVSALVSLMDVPSDDFFAEMLTKQLGVRFGGAGTTAAGAAVIRQVIAGYGVHPQIVDGSGLSRADQSSPGQVVALLRRVWHTDVGRILTASLPVVGVSGTVAGLSIGTPAQGRCFAKTGTLNNVTNLAGYCAAQGGHSIAFAFFIDGPPNSKALPRLGHLVSAVARY